MLASVAILKFRSADEGNDNDYKILGIARCIDATNTVGIDYAKS